MALSPANHSVAKEELADGRILIKVYEGAARPREILCQDSDEADLIYYREYERQRKAAL